MAPAHDSRALLDRSLASRRLHTAYLLSGPGERPRVEARRFARGSVCTGPDPRPCETCASCRRSADREEVALDGTGKQGPLLRHIGDHPDLFWVERGADDTRVRIAQVRALQHALRLRSSEGGHRTAVLADAEWMNQESQNALLRLLEEPPPGTTIVLVASSRASLLATLRSRCQRVAFPAESAESEPDAERAELLARLDRIERASIADLLDWADEYRGGRAQAAARVEALLDTASTWLRRRAARRAAEQAPLRGEIEAFHTLSGCRKALAQRNANPQMVAERALLALQAGIAA